MQEALAKDLEQAQGYHRAALDDPLQIDPPQQPDLGLNQRDHADGGQTLSGQHHLAEDRAGLDLGLPWLLARRRRPVHAEAAAAEPEQDFAGLAGLMDQAARSVGDRGERCLQPFPVGCLQITEQKIGRQVLRAD